MAIPALLIGAGVVGVMWATSQKPSAAPPNAPANPATTDKGAGGTGDLATIAADVAAAGSGQPAQGASTDPAQTGNPAQTTTTIAGDTGAVTQTTDNTAGGTTGTSVSPATPTYATPESGPATAPTATYPVKTASMDSIYLAQAGAMSTKVDQSNYFQQQASAGNIIY